MPDTKAVAAEPITDRTLVRLFENTTLPPDRFGHTEHVRLAWIYLQSRPLAEAVANFQTGLKRYTRAHACPDKYHETITWGYMLLINERIQRGPGGQTWVEFARDNPDVMRFKGGAFMAFYRPETLRSQLARRVFVLPDSGIASR